ncbi:hypothetical protein [Nostoc sp. CHAB 5715]|uniref:hypothetical protein n=1 Tax=Nostoc sp. CHAB 5715 TaxID=2780400 RepID=UPI001E47985F|nr:hypothetical protein [Nostoc sp. CHAB 5715]
MITIRSFISQSLIGLALLSATVVFTQTATAETITGESGDVRAEISYDTLPVVCSFWNSRRAQ